MSGRTDSLIKQHVNMSKAHDDRDSIHVTGAVSPLKGNRRLSS